MTSKSENNLEQTDVQSVSDKSRRKALKNLVAGTGVAVGAAALPGKWVKPVVDRVLVPAHAQTSTTTTTTTAAPTTTTTTTTTTEEPTTTPCEIIPDQYCWSYILRQFFMSITVGADGSIDIQTNQFGPNMDPISVPLTGGSFTAQTDGATITGEVLCNSNSISGTVLFQSDNTTVAYTATLAECAA